MGIIAFPKNLFRAGKQAYWSARVRRGAGECKGRVRANHKTMVTRNTILGENVNFNGMEISGGGKVRIGSNFHSGKHCQIITSFHDYDRGDAVPYGDAYVYKDVNIGDNVWLGNDVIVLGGVSIGEGAIVQAGSVVCRDIPKCGIAGGHPAQTFKYRDIEHYERLRDEGRFH